MSLLEGLLITLRFNGYILLYIIGTIVAAFIGRLGVHIAERILRLVFGSRVTAWTDNLELCQKLCILASSAGFLLVAVGLLLMHETGGLSKEQGEIAIGVAIADFGVLLFTFLCIIIVGVMASLFRALEYCCPPGNPHMDEETGLLKGYRSRSYDGSVSIDDDEEEEGDSRTDEEVEGEDDRMILAQQAAELEVPDPVWIQMSTLGSCR